MHRCHSQGATLVTIENRSQLQGLKTILSQTPNEQYTIGLVNFKTSSCFDYATCNDTLLWIENGLSLESQSWMDDDIDLFNSGTGGEVCNTGQGKHGSYLFTAIISTFML